MKGTLALALALVLVAVAGCVDTDQPAGSPTTQGTPPADEPPGHDESESGQDEPPNDPEPSDSDDPDPSDPGEPEPSPGPAPPSEAQPPAQASPANQFDCGGQQVVEEYATHGSGDQNVTNFTWAALKLGQRFAIAWTTANQETGKIEYLIGEGIWQAAGEGSRRRGHVVILDDLPIGETICFRVLSDEGNSDIHAARLANAMNAYDAADGTYTINLLTLANQAPRKENLEGGYEVYGEKLWDATDGYIRGGTNIVVYGDLDNHNNGWISCYIPSRFVTLPACTHLFDVIFSYESEPRAAGFTYMDGIRQPDEAIWMNQLYEAGPVTGTVFTAAFERNEVGHVLLHELGHYAFGAMDLYGAVPGADDCYNQGQSLSIMGNNRDATEFDDDINRCPNEGDIPGYESSWSLLRQRFPLIPDRAGHINPGPEGNGGAFSVVAIDASAI